VNCLIGEYKLNETEQLLDEIMPACREAGGQVCALSSTLGGKQTDNFGHQFFCDDFFFAPKIISRASPFSRASSLAFTELNRVCVCVCVCVCARARAQTRQWYIKAIQSQAFNLFKQYKFQDALKVRFRV